MKRIILALMFIPFIGNAQNINVSKQGSANQLNWNLGGGRFDKYLGLPLLDSAYWGNISGQRQYSDLYRRKTDSALMIHDVTTGFDAPLESQTLTPEAFGAKGDGVSNDSAAMQMAINSGETIFLTGEYLTGKLSVPSNFKIYGTGTLIQTRPNSDILDASNSNNVIIQGIHFIGNGAGLNSDANRNSGVYCIGGSNIKINGCEFSNFEGSGIHFRNVIDYTISENYFHDNKWGLNASSSDIFIYSLVDGRRGKIINNTCNSANSQGIYVNANGYDTDILISGNICSTLDSLGNEFNFNGYTNVSTVRRHGIIVSYSGQNFANISVVNNLIKNTGWSGIYTNVNHSPANTGKFIISNNQVLRFGMVNAYGATGALSGGILVKGGGDGDIISNNVIDSSTYAPAIKIDQDFVSGHKTIIIGNSIDKSFIGIDMGNNSSNVSIEGNVIQNSTRQDISHAVNPGDTTIGGDVWIIQNKFYRNNTNYQSVFINTQSGVKYVTVENNRFYGAGNSVSATTNSAMFFSRLLFYADNNRVENYYYGIYIQPIIADSTRNFNLFTADYNYFKSCNTGVACRANSNSTTTPFVGNIFSGVTTNFSGAGSFNSGYAARRLGINLEIYQNTIPTNGTWIIGDRVAKTTPLTGGNDGWVCTVAGTPGTWSTSGFVGGLPNVLTNSTDANNAQLNLSAGGPILSTNTVGNVATQINLQNSSSTSDILSLQFQGSPVGRFNRLGTLSLSSIQNISGAANSSVNVNTTGTVVSSSKANSDIVLTVTNSNASSPGKIISGRNSTGEVFSYDINGFFDSPSIASTIDFGSVSANAELAAPSTITLTGAVVGDAVLIGSPYTAGINYKAVVSSTNTITLYAVNNTILPIDPASGSFKITVIK